MSHPGEKILLFAASNSFPSDFSSQIQNILKKIEHTINLVSGNILRIQGHFPESIKNQLTPLCDSAKIDFILIEAELFFKKKKLIVFDMDSTLIAAEVIDELAKIHGIGEKVSHITERAMRGELNFDASLKERVALLHGLSEEQLGHVYKSISFTPGTEDFLKKAHASGIKTAIASGGFVFFAERFSKRLRMDYFFANQLEVQNKILTGKTIGEIINAERKAELLVKLTSDLGLESNEVVAVGDGANDLLMLAEAGMGVAFHAKEKVRKATNYQINHGGMTVLSSYLGLS